MTSAGPAPGPPRNWVAGIMCGAYLLVLGFLFVVVIPKFGEMFREMELSEAALPRSTALVLAVSAWLGRLWFVCLPVAVGISLLASRIPPGAMRFVTPIFIVAAGGLVLLVALALVAPQLHMMGDGAGQ
ncbi:MAG TPA: hypothetical protein PK280_06375 [Planctomycetota bacterium]|nr:hypothetical protein [Planctomycetota bacterium]